MIDVQQILDFVGKKLSPDRFRHVLGVVATAEKLCIHHHGNLQRVMICAALHDVAKEMPKKQVLDLFSTNNYELDEISRKTPALWHSHAVLLIGQLEFGFTHEYLGPCRWHTTGKADMDRDEVILYVADQIEPGRTWIGDELRKLATTDLMKTLQVCLETKLEFTLKSGKMLHRDSVDCWNWCVGEIRK